MNPTFSSNSPMVLDNDQLYYQKLVEMKEADYKPPFIPFTIYEYEENKIDFGTQAKEKYFYLDRSITHLSIQLF